MSLRLGQPPRMAEHKRLSASSGLHVMSTHWAMLKQQPPLHSRTQTRCSMRPVVRVQVPEWARARVLGRGRDSQQQGRQARARRGKEGGRAWRRKCTSTFNGEETGTAGPLADLLGGFYGSVKCAWQPEQGPLRRVETLKSTAGAVTSIGCCLPPRSAKISVRSAADISGSVSRLWRVHASGP